MKEKIVGALETVELLNERIFKVNEKLVVSEMFTYQTNGLWKSVEFNGVHLWNDQDDSRFYDLQGNYESYEDCFIRLLDEKSTYLKKVVEAMNINYWDSDTTETDSAD